MALSFPSNPSVGDLYQTGSSATYEFNGSYWTVISPSTQVFVTAESASYATTSSFSETGSYSVTASYSVSSSKLIGYDFDSGVSNITIGATTTAPTKGNVVEMDRLIWSYQNGILNLQLQYFQEVNTGASAGSGDYLFSLPSGYAFDSNYTNFYDTIGTAGARIFLWYGIGGSGMVTSGNSMQRRARVIPYNSTQFRIFLLELYDGSSGGTFKTSLSNTTLPLVNSNIGYSVDFMAKVVRV